METLRHNPQNPLEGHISIISGGLGDIGSAIAIELAQRGSDIAIGDLRRLNESESLLQK